LSFAGHRAPVRSLATSLDGQYLASGDDHGCLKLWEVATGRCLRSWVLRGTPASQQRKKAADDSDASGSDDDGGDDGSGGEPESPIAHVCWNPNRLHAVLAVACGSSVFLVATGTGGAEATELTDALLSAAELAPSGPPQGATGAPLLAVTWGAETTARAATEAAAAAGLPGKGRFGSAVGVRVRLQFSGAVTCLC
jgi:WD40 repeat protein